jgi:hypothetical protein
VILTICSANPSCLGAKEFGITNAVILAEPNAPFLRRWLDAYRSFRSKGKDEFWDEHSVVLPAKLARKYPQDITVLSEKAFFWPLWHDDTSIGFSDPIGRSLWIRLMPTICTRAVPGCSRRSDVWRGPRPRHQLSSMGTVLSG